MGLPIKFQASLALFFCNKIFDFGVDLRRGRRLFTAFIVFQTQPLVEWWNW